MPKQLQRILLLLSILVIIFIGLRHYLIPESFGELGHYRANSLLDNEAHIPKYLGNDFCIDCHDSEASLLTIGKHSKIKCETCHGPGFKHVESNEKVDIILPSGRDFCGLCHSLNKARPINKVKQVDIKEHNIEETECINCHNPHEPWN